MSDKQQQILQMAKDICRVKLNCNDVCNPISACDALKYAERAVEAGYVKVVRCKECIYNNGTCTHSEIYDDPNYNPDYYCADGERKDNE